MTRILDLIGHTPIVQTQHLDTGKCSLFLKLENQNPGGSIKDRMARSMIDEAEKSGALKPGGLIVEATAGNTGLGLALIASQRGYKLTLVIPDKMSQEKIQHLRALGAEVILTRSDVGKGHPEFYSDKAKAIAKATPGAFFADQFSNPSNPDAHEATTGPEIWEQMEHKVDAVVAGAGTGGTITGIARYLKKVSPQTEIILADPKGSVLAAAANKQPWPAPGSYLVEGIGQDYVPDNLDLSLLTKGYTVDDEESINTAQQLLLKEGILAGSSSGTLIAAALRYCHEQTTPKRVVTFVCDSGNKYLSKIYNRFWLNDQGLLHEPAQDSLADLISRSFRRGEVVSIKPSDTLQAAFAKMKMYDVSQLPVIEEGKLLGIIDETDLLLAVTDSAGGFTRKVQEAMTSRVETVDVRQKPHDLPPLFRKGHVGVIMDKDQFLGLITPIDLLNYLRKRNAA
mgnify:CR=1 FL=1